MHEQGCSATIVNTASALGLVAMARMAPYCASKFGVVGLSEALQAELAPRGIHVCAVCPGIIDTPITRNAVLRGEPGERREDDASAPISGSPRIRRPPRRRRRRAAGARAGSPARR